MKCGIKYIWKTASIYLAQNSTDCVQDVGTMLTIFHVKKTWAHYQFLAWTTEE